MVSPCQSNPEELGCGGALLWWGGGQVAVGAEGEGDHHQAVHHPRGPPEPYLHSLP